LRLISATDLRIGGRVAEDVLWFASDVPAVRAVCINAVLDESKELFERTEPQFAACVYFLDVSLELALTGVRLWAQANDKCAFHISVQA
jgi:hypothetical protein